MKRSLSTCFVNGRHISRVVIAVLVAASIPSNRPVNAEDVESVERKSETKGNLIGYQHEFSTDDLAYIRKTAWDVHRRYSDQARKAVDRLCLILLVSCLK